MPQSRLVALTGSAMLCLAAALAGGASAAGLPSDTTTRNDSAVTFTPATVVDPILYGGEPGVHVDPTDKKGNRVFVDWPVTSRSQIGVLFRSTDGGLSYTKRYADVTSPTEGGPGCAGRQTPFCFSGGGGDTDININPSTGVVHMGSQEVLVNQAVGNSLDHGTTFPTDHVDPIVAKSTGVDRQWLASLKGTHTVFLAYHVPVAGIFVHRSDQDGMVGSWSPSPVPVVTQVSQTGGMQIDNSNGIHKGTIYIGYLGFTTGMAVAVSSDGGTTWQSHAVPGGSNARNFTVIGLDSAGNLYATYVDSGTNKTYLVTSKADAGANKAAPGSVWSAPVLVSAEPLHLTIFANLVAGDPGRVAVGYYGSTAKASSPDNVVRGKGGWSPYVAVSVNALCQWAAKPCANGPAFHQSVISDHINQDDNICTSGTACAATMGNRNLADYFALNIDPAGHLIAVWSDAYNKQTDGTLTGWPTVVTARQATGPSLYAGKPNAKLSRRANGAPDKAGDALYPLAGARALTATNHPTLDLLGTTVSLKDSKTLEVRMKLASGHGLGGGIPNAGSLDSLTQIEQAKYVTRFDLRGHVYYLGASVAAGEASPLAYFSGEVGPQELVVNPAYGPNAPYGNTYKALSPAKGHVDHNTLVVDVPTSVFGGVKRGDRLDTVMSFSMIGEKDSNPTSNLLTNLPFTIDSTPSFDVVLGSSKPAPPPGPAKASGAGITGLDVPSVSGPAALIAGAGLLLLLAAAALQRRETHPRVPRPRPALRVLTA
ncbi:MAG: hypothetical protein M3N21_07840 [Actinomycetota bacterium]|nr:hypothetical protein [Actinomycetota bacterium]